MCIQPIRFQVSIFRSFQKFLQDHEMWLQIIRFQGAIFKTFWSAPIKWTKSECSSTRSKLCFVRGSQLELLHFACDQDGFWGRCHEASWCCGVFLAEMQEMLPKLSVESGCDVRYTNHSLTATVATRMFSMGVLEKDILSGTLSNCTINIPYNWNVFLPCTPLLMYTRAIVLLILILLYT